MYFSLFKETKNFDFYCMFFSAVCVAQGYHITGKVLPKKRAFYNRDFKKSTSRSKNFSLFQTYKFLWKRENFLRLFSLNSQRIPSTPLFWQYYVICRFFYSAFSSTQIP